MRDLPWSAFTRYEGGFRSRVIVNGGVPLTVDAALDLACHETYPGHHTISAKRGRMRRKRFFAGMVVTVALTAPFGLWWVWPVLWLVPQATWLPMISRLRNIAEHACVARNEPDPLRHARTTHANWLERAVNEAVPGAAVSFSAGLASFPEDASDAVALARIADQRLYAAKP